MVVGSPTRAHTPASGPVMVEGGHYTLASRACNGEEVIDVPGSGPFWAATTETTRRCIALAAEEVHRVRASGCAAHVGLMVGDLAVPSGQRQTGGGWAIPGSYRVILREHDLSVDDVVVWGEAYCRNQGKRRLLDEARRRHASAEQTYAAWGWALLRDAEGIRLASDSSLDWDGDVRAAVLTRGVTPLCPLVFAGLKRAIFQAGYARHVAIYARADDAWIDVKLRAAAATVAQLRLGAVGEQVDRILVGPAGTGESTWSAADLVAPGERTWSDFLAEVREHHPGASELENPCLPMAPSSPPACGATKTPSPCSA